MLFNTKKSTVAVTLAVLLLSGFGAMQVLADDDEHEGREPFHARHVAKPTCRAWPGQCGCSQGFPTCPQPPKTQRGNPGYSGISGK